MPHHAFRTVTPAVAATLAAGVLTAALLAREPAVGAEPARSKAAAIARGVARGDPVRGKSISDVCGPCHDGDGRTRFAIYPRIAGQSYEYLYISLKEFRTRERRQAYASQMWPAVEKLSDRDLRDIAAYYSELPW